MILITISERFPFLCRELQDLHLPRSAQILLRWQRFRSVWVLLLLHCTWPAGSPAHGGWERIIFVMTGAERSCGFSPAHLGGNLKPEAGFFLVSLFPDSFSLELQLR